MGTGVSYNHFGWVDLVAVYESGVEESVTYSSSTCSIIVVVVVVVVVIVGGGMNRCHLSVIKVKMEDGPG